MIMASSSVRTSALVLPANGYLSLCPMMAEKTNHTPCITVTNNNFMWLIPSDWDSTQITRFTQHAASIGCPDFPLFMDLSTRVDGPGYKCYPHAPLREGCRDNLDRWMMTVYYGVETRVLVNDCPLRRDDGLIAHFLHQAQQVSMPGLQPYFSFFFFLVFSSDLQ